MDVPDTVADEVLPDGDTLMNPDEVGLMFNVDPRTTVRWAREQRVPSMRTPGGHYRFSRKAMLEVLSRGMTQEKKKG